MMVAQPASQYTNVTSSLILFGTEALPPAHDLARLHGSLLPTSPIALLGRRFMERFYYMRLPQSGLIFGSVAYVDEQPAGFIVATDDPAGFMQSAVRRWWPSLLWVVGTSVVLAPSSLGAVWQASRVMMSRQPVERHEREGEILSFGVLPQYRQPAFIRQSGLRLSNALLDNTVDQLRQRGVRVMRATVSAENTPAKLFYSGLGWTLDQTSAPGWRHPTVQFVERL